jgi:mono/diheme cytochrome c family protein
MRFLILSIAATVIVSIAAAQNPTPASNNAAPPGNAVNGKKIYAAYGCYECHGYEGQGGVGARLAPGPRPFAYVSAYVRQPTRNMPPYTKKVMTDQELADIYAFLLTIPPAPAVASIPLLNDAP